EKSDRPVLFSIVVAAKDPMVQSFIRYGLDRAMSEAKAKGLPTDNPAFGPAFDKQKEFKLQDLGIRMIGVSWNAFNQEKVGAAVALEWNNETIAKTMAGFVQPQFNMLNRLLSDDNLNGPPPPGGFPNPDITPRPGGSGTIPLTPMGSSGNNTSLPPGGSSMYGPGFPGGNPADAVKGPLDLNVDKSLTTLSASLPFKTDQFQDAEQALGQFMIHLKGDSDLLSTRSRIHDLAGALTQYVKANGQFPRGTANRRTNGEQFADWAPYQ